jgi:hypothetical protein
MDQPAASLDMINKFMRNKDLAADDDGDVVEGSATATGNTQQPAAAAGGVRQSLRPPAASGSDPVAVV